MSNSTSNDDQAAIEKQLSNDTRRAGIGLMRASEGDADDDDRKKKKKELYQKVYQQQVLLEEKRVRQCALELVKCAQENNCTPVATLCGLCHVPLPLSFDYYQRDNDNNNKKEAITDKEKKESAAMRFPCCGKPVCMKCLLEKVERSKDPNDSFEMTNCLFCGAEPATQMRFEVVLRLAEQDGHAWAQDRVGVHYETGQGDGVEKDMEQAVRWYKKAAAQGFPRSETTLGIYYHTGAKEGIPKSPLQARQYLEKAAMKGDPYAMFYLFQNYNTISDEQEAIHDLEERLDYDVVLTVSAGKGCVESQIMLGLLYCDESGRVETYEYSLERAEYWLTKAKEQGTQSALALYTLAACLMKRANEYFGKATMVGCSPMPRAYAILLEAKSLGNDEADKMVRELEQKAKDACAHCGKNNTAGDLKRCTRCRINFYCNKNCQSKHWRAGHKLDCIECKNKM